MGKYTQKLQELKRRQAKERINYTRINQYLVGATNEDGEERTFRTSGNYEYIQNFMDELRDQGFDNVSIISQY